LSAVLLKICARDADLDFLSTIDLIADLLSPVVQAIIYVISYELVADVLSTLGLVVLVFDFGNADVAAVAASTVAVVWNCIWLSGRAESDPASDSRS
jgi:hypothetical protein